MARNKEENSLTEELSFSAIRKHMSHIKADTDPLEIMKKYGDAVQIYKSSSKRQKKKLYDNLLAISMEAFRILGLENHYPLAETVTQNRPLVIELAKQLVEEYKCVSPSEKTLVHAIVGAYGRILEYSRLLNSCQRQDYITHELVGYYSMLSKELDRANRQYLNALMALRQIKLPEVRIHIKAENAFVAQNQQLNNNSYENDKP